MLLISQIFIMENINLNLTKSNIIMTQSHYKTILEQFYMYLCDIGRAIYIFWNISLEFHNVLFILFILSKCTFLINENGFI
jgi:hypothetical protein